MCDAIAAGGICGTDTPVCALESTQQKMIRSGSNRRNMAANISGILRRLAASSVLLRWWLLIVVIALSIHLGGFPLLDPDEGRNAEVGREMAATNDYVMPRLDGLPYLDKPIVYFAAEAAVMEVLGPTEVAARLPAFLFTLAGAAFLWWFARRRSAGVPPAGPDASRVRAEAWLAF